MRPINYFQDGGRVADFRLEVSFYCLVGVLLTENGARNKIEYHQILLLNAVWNEAKRNADKTNRLAKGSRWNARAMNTRVNLNRKTNFICQEK